MTAKPKSRETRARKIVQSSDIEDRIRRRAYQLYEERGKVHGFALDDWLLAERELLGAGRPRKAKSARAAQC